MTVKELLKDFSAEFNVMYNIYDNVNIKHKVLWDREEVVDFCGEAIIETWDLGFDPYVKALEFNIYIG